MSVEEIKKLVKGDKLVKGSKETLKLLKKGELSKIFLASNCPGNTEELISHYASIAKIPITKLKIRNDELGTVCRRSHNISVLSVRK